MKMEDLKFPLFETTEEEKDVLRKAKELITADNFYLCHILEDMEEFELINTVQSSLETSGSTIISSLSSLNVSKYFDFWDWYKASEENDVLARKVWVDKLLAYSG